MRENSSDTGQFWASLSYEVLHATASLMYLLEGMERVRDRVVPRYHSYPSEVRQGAVCPPELSYVDIPLVESGPGADLDEVWGRNGAAEQLAYKGWVEEVYSRVWEGDLRNVMQARHEGTGSIRPLNEVWGDFRLIRNDLVHNAGIASAEKTGRCQVLKWFRPGDRMLLTMAHVIDLLNQLGMLTRVGGFKPDGTSISWFVIPTMRKGLEQRPTPRIVSLRTMLIDAGDDGTSGHGICVAFENGVWSGTLLERPSDGTSIEDRIAFMEQTRIDNDGNVQLADGTRYSRHDVYRSGIAVHLRRRAPR